MNKQDNKKNGTPPNIITRKKTIILEASEKESKINQPSNKFSTFTDPNNGDWETILNGGGVEMSNGDVLEIQNAFIDTTKIDPDTVTIKDDTIVSWSNGLYIMNNQFKSLAWAYAETNLQQTDNQPYIFSSYNVESANGAKAVGQRIVSASCISWDGVTLGNWGNNYPITLEYIDINGDTVTSTITTSGPGYHANTWGKTTTGSYLVNIIIKTGTIASVRALNPSIQDGGNWVPPGDDVYFYASDVRYISIPFSSPVLEDIEETAVLTPVIHRGQFTLSAGEYDPTHLAEIMNKNFTKIEKTKLSSTVLRMSGSIYSPFEFIPEGGPPPTQVTPELISFVTQFAAGDTASWYYPTGRDVATDLNNKYTGWKLQLTYSTSPPGTSSNFTFATFDTEIIDNTATDILHTLRFKNPPVVGEVSTQFLLNAAYPSGGGPRMIITPPADFDTQSQGAALLQNTGNYRFTEADGKPKFVFASQTDPSGTIKSNILNFHTTNDIFFGSNQFELTWDTDRKRYRFDYLHYPITSGGDDYAITLSSTLRSKSSGGGLAYTSAFADGAEKMISCSYGGIFFTDLQPRSLFQNIMGFSFGNDPNGHPSILASITSTKNSQPYTGGLPFDGVTPTTYEDVVGLLGNLEPGVNITENLVTIGDITGLQLNYQTGVAFTESNDPVTNAGRVAVLTKMTNPIDAMRTVNGVGTLDTGYYILEVQASFDSVESIGSNTQFTKNMRVIVNRYYNMDSYTSMASDGIQYIHYGKPTRLSSIKCRVLNPDGTRIFDLGRDNTVFLKLIKNIEVEIPNIKQ